MKGFKACAAALLRALLALAATSVLAQSQQTFDPVRVDPRHFKVEYEDAKVRVLRFRLLPGEKSPMAEHPGRSLVSLTNSKRRTLSCTGEVRDFEFQAGQAVHVGPMRHSVENIGAQVLEIVSTEFND